MISLLSTNNSRQLHLTKMLLLLGLCSLCYPHMTISVCVCVSVCVSVSYSGELRLRPSVVRSEPSARWTMPGSVSAARMNVSKPIIPNWSVTMPTGMLVTRPGTQTEHVKMAETRVGWKNVYWYLKKLSQMPDRSCQVLPLGVTHDSTAPKWNDSP